MIGDFDEMKTEEEEMKDKLKELKENLDFVLARERNHSDSLGLVKVAITTLVKILRDKGIMSRVEVDYIKEKAKGMIPDIIE